MNKMSDGVTDSTLGNHRRIAAALFGDDSAAVKFLDEKIATSPNGPNEPVICDESQLVYLLLTIEAKAHGHTT
jgi:hypothetical protein